MDDTITLVCTRPAVNQVTTVTMPVAIVTILQALAENAKIPDPDNPGQMKAKYTDAIGVIFADMISMLFPFWQQLYVPISTAAAIAQIQAAQSTISQAVQDGVAAITMVDQEGTVAVTVTDANGIVSTAGAVPVGPTVGSPRK